MPFLRQLYFLPFLRQLYFLTFLRQLYFLPIHSISRIDWDLLELVPPTLGRPQTLAAVKGDCRIVTLTRRSDSKSSCAIS